VNSQPAMFAPLSTPLPRGEEILGPPAPQAPPAAAADAAATDQLPAGPAAGPAAAETGQRREERVPLDLVIFTYPLDETERAPTRSESRNVSPTGMFIATERPESKGRVLFLEAFPNGSDEPPVRSRAVVRWRRRWLEPRGMGVELMDVGDEDRDRLRRWMGQGR